MEKTSPDESGFVKVEIPDVEEVSRSNESSVTSKISPINISILLEEIEDLRRKIQEKDQKLEKKTQKIDILKDENRLQKKELEKQYWELKHLRKENEELKKAKRNEQFVEETIQKLQINQPDSS